MSQPKLSVTLNDLAIAAVATYGGINAPALGQGWKSIDVAPPGSPLAKEMEGLGYYGQAHVNLQTGEIIIANRGTVGSLQNVIADAQVSIGVRQLAQDVADSFAIAALDAAKDQLRQSGMNVSAIYTTGHSLGGSESQGQAAKLSTGQNPDGISFLDSGVRVTNVSFNSPGISGLMGKPDSSNYTSYNLTTRGDIVHYVGGSDLSGTKEVELQIGPSMWSTGGLLALGLAAPPLIDKIITAIGLSNAMDAHSSPALMKGLYGTALGNLLLSEIDDLTPAQLQNLSRVSAADFFAMTLAEKVALIGKIPSTPDTPVIDISRFDQNGYDKNGYNIYGLDVNGKLDPSIAIAGRQINIHMPGDGPKGSVVIARDGSLIETVQSADGSIYTYSRNAAGNLTGVTLEVSDGTGIAHSVDPKTGLLVESTGSSGIRVEKAEVLIKASDETTQNANENNIVQGWRIQERINTSTTRTITHDADGSITETRVAQTYNINEENFVLDDVANHVDNTRTLTVRDTNGNIKKTENIAVDAAPLQMTDKASKEMQTDVVSFLNALRQKDKAGIIISTARLVLDYAHTQGVVPVAYDTVVGDASSALNFVGSLRALQSGDMLTQVGGAVGLLNSTNYFASRMAANNTGFLSTTQTQALNTVGAILSIANLANLGSMIDNHQFGSAAATVVAAANSIAYLTSASTSLMGTGALFPINPIAMIVIAYALDTLFAEDPPPPPPQGLLSFVRQADGRLAYRITESNDLGKSILSRQVDLLLPKLEAQLAQANGGIFDNDHTLLLVASRMPAVRLSAWPSHADNGVSNYFFVLEQSDPLKDDPNYVGVARQDLVRLYAETLVLPEALVQRWEVDHLRQKFGPDEANWQTEGEWLRGRSPTEKQRTLLQKEVDRSTAAWQASATVKFALSSWVETGNVALQKQNDAAQEASRLCMEEAKAALAAYAELHPLDPFEVARATPEQERDFAQTHQARETVSLQWLKVITVDLGGDGVSLIDLPGNVGTDLESLRQQHVARFDVDGDGFVEATQWIAPSEAMLGIDRSGNGLIDNGSELFNGTDTPFDQHGLAALAYYDANGDGSITEADPVYKHLRLWVDLDSDGSAGALEVFDMQMHSALSGAAGSAAPSGKTDALAAMVVTAIDLSTMRMQFADGSSAALSDTALLSHTKGLKIVMDEATANLNVLHEDGLRENFITLTQDMSVLQELQLPTLSSTRRTELEALARRYGLNPASADFAGIVQSLRATGETLGQQDTVIYFGDDAVWVDPQVRLRLEQMRISFRKLGDGAADNTAGESQLGRFGSAPDSQPVNADGSFNDRWVVSRKLTAADIISDAISSPDSKEPQSVQWMLPADVYSLLQVTKGAQSGGLVTERAIIASDSAQPQAAPQTIQVFTTAQPVAQLHAAQLTVNEDSSLSFSYAQLEQEARLLLAASDPYASVQLLGIRSARHGTVQMDDVSGRLSFKPQQDYAGVAGFTYVLMNQQGQVLERDVALNLREVNDAPLVVGETIRSREDIPLLIDSATLLANDHDVEGDAMTITGIGRVGLGKAELLGNGQIHYTPPSDQYGITDTVEYIVQDSRGASLVGKINITLDAVDDAPSVVSERIIHAREDQTLRIASRLLLWNDIDLDTDARIGAAPLSLTAVGSPEHGKVRLEAGGEIVFVPEANYNGEAAFSYTVKDETGLSTTGRALIRIDPVNDVPLVASEQISSKEDERLVMDPALLLANDYDLDIARSEKQSLSVVAVDQATGGRVQMQDGLIVFVPEANRNGDAGFRYTVSDGAGGFGQGKVDITLAPVNDAPVLPPVSLTAAEDTTLLIPTARLLEGVSDVDSDNTAFQLLSVGNANGGTVEWLNQQVIFHPTAD